MLNTWKKLVKDKYVFNLHLRRENSWEINCCCSTRGIILCSFSLAPVWLRVCEQVQVSTQSEFLLLAEESDTLQSGQAISNNLHGEPEHSKPSGSLPQLPEVVIKERLLFLG